MYAVFLPLFPQFLKPSTVLPSSKGYPQPYISCMPISSTLKEGATKEYIAAYNGYQNIRSKVCASIQCAFYAPSRHIRFSREMVFGVF